MRTSPARVRLAQPRRALSLALVAAIALLTLAACGRAGELIPGEGGTATATATATAEGTATAPVLSPPPTNGDSGTGGPVIPDTELARSVVQLTLTAGDGSTVRTGSGVVVDREAALLLTSLRLVDPFGPDGAPAYDAIVVGTNRTPGEDPRDEYLAEIAAADQASGLVVLRVTSAADGGALATGDFDLPAAAVGDPLALRHDEPLRLFGHPSAGGDDSDAVAVTNATITGFRGAAAGGRHWLLTDARIPAGAAGGPAFDANGALVGVLSQLAYDPVAPVGFARPVHLAAPLLEAARGGGNADLIALLQHPGAAPGTSAPAGPDGASVDGPAFAENAVETSDSRELFDYTGMLPAGVPELYYEFAVQGAAEGATVQELWYLDDVLQDGLSSSYAWSFGSLALISDRLVAPTPQGLPSGRWRLEVWIDDVLRASGLALVGVEPRTPEITRFRFSTVAGIDQAPGAPPVSGADRVLAFFDYTGTAAVSSLRWVVFHEGRLVYQSPAVPWRGGSEGTWWVGYRDPAGIPAGSWEFEIYLDDQIVGSSSVPVF